MSSDRGNEGGNAEEGKSVGVAGRAGRQGREWRLGAQDEDVPKASWCPLTTTGRSPGATLSTAK